MLPRVRRMFGVPARLLICPERVMRGPKLAIVIQPGGPRLSREMASGLARARLLRAYVTTLAFSRRATSTRWKPVRRQLERRPLPEGLSKDQVIRRRSASEMCYLTGKRLPGKHLIQPWRRARRFDAVASRLVQPDDGSVIATYAGALDTFRRASDLGVARILDYPICHHRHAMAVLTEEAEREPEYAATLQNHELPSELTERLDLEIQLADRILAFSQTHADSFTRAGVSNDRLIVAPLGVDADLFSPRPSSGRSSKGSFRIAFVGQITQRKGLSYVIRAIESAFGGSNHVELLLVGPLVGTGRPWRALPWVRHIPGVPRAKLPTIYASADVFVLPSLVEGFAQTPLEAMACGLPTIVSDQTFGKGVIRHGVDGFVVSIRDPDSIARILVELHENPSLRKRIGQRARARSQQFSWDRFRAQIATETAAVMIPR
jgi:glycosyltransferase involved in cell wall biosynthesis